MRVLKKCRNVESSIAIVRYATCVYKIRLHDSTMCSQLMWTVNKLKLQVVTIWGLENSVVVQSTVKDMRPC